MRDNREEDNHFSSQRVVWSVLRRTNIGGCCGRLRHGIPHVGAEGTEERIVTLREGELASGIDESIDYGMVSLMVDVARGEAREWDRRVVRRGRLRHGIPHRALLFS